MTDLEETPGQLRMRLAESYLDLAKAHLSASRDRLATATQEHNLARQFLEREQAQQKDIH